MTKQTLQDFKVIEVLVKKLSFCKQVTQYDDQNNKEAWELAHHLSDIDESCKVISQQLIPQMIESAVGGDDFHDLLLKIGEELRHVLYHTTNSKFFSYLK